MVTLKYFFKNSLTRFWFRAIIYFAKANKIDEDTYFDFMSMEKGSRKWNEKLDTIIEGIKKDVDEFYRQEIGNDNADGLDVDYFLSLDYDNDVDNFEE